MEETANALSFSDGADGAQEPVVAALAKETGEESAAAGAATPQEPAEQEDGQETEPSPAPAQSREENAAAKAARLAGQREAAERLQRDWDARIAAYGVTNPDTGRPFGSMQEFMAYGESIQAGQMGVSVEQLRAQEAERARVARMEQDLDTAHRELARERAGSELAQLKKAFPEITAESTYDLGDNYFALRLAGASPEVSYAAIKEAKSATAKPAPPSMGGLSKTAPEKEYLSSDELDNLTQEELLDKPGLLDKALKSMARLGK